MFLNSVCLTKYQEGVFIMEIVPNEFIKTLIIVTFHIIQKSIEISIIKICKY